MGRKIIIALAPTGGWGAGQNNPVTPEEIASEVISCVDSGASVLHIHARDRKGDLTPDQTAFNETVQLIKQETDIILEASTGGLSELTAAQRVIPAAHPAAEMGSLNIGSLNFGDQVYQNSVPDVRYWIAKMAEVGLKPSLEIFDTGHLETALHLIDEGLLTPPCNFSFIFGVSWGMVYDPDLLAYLVSRLPADSRWGGIFIGSRDFSAHLEAAAAGAAAVRVGFEDSREYQGHTARSNLELVTSLREELLHEGFEIIGVTEARKTLVG
jgi:3-keto-5-aminohexanoate cleavage enzyme